MAGSFANGASAEPLAKWTLFVPPHLTGTPAWPTETFAITIAAPVIRRRQVGSRIILLQPHHLPDGFADGSQRHFGAFGRREALELLDDLGRAHTES